MLTGGCNFSTMQARIYRPPDGSRKITLWRCQIDWLNEGSAPVEYSADSAGHKWCLLHRTEPAESPAPGGPCVALLEQVCRKALEHKILDLSGVSFTWDELMPVLDPAGAFGAELPDDWWSKLAGGICLDWIVASQTVTIRDIDAPPVTLCCRGAELRGDLLIENCQLKGIDLTGAKISGDLILRGCTIGEDIMLDGIRVEGKMSIVGIAADERARIGQAVSVNGGQCHGAIVMQHLQIGSGSGLRPALILDSHFDDAMSRFASFHLLDTLIDGDIQVGGPQIDSTLEFQRCKLTGHLLVGDSKLPDNVFIRELEIVPAAVSPEARASRAIRYRREFHVLRHATQRSGDIEATSQLLRTSRMVEGKLRSVDPMHRISWWLHEIASASSESWSAPILWLAVVAFASFGLSAAVLTVQGLPIVWGHLFTLSLSNTFLPFSFTDLWFVSNMPISVLIVATAHSALSVGLIAALAMAIRARQIPAD